MCRITNSTERNHIKIKKKNLENFILKYDVIHDALEVMYNKNLKRPRNFGDIGTRMNSAKNFEIA